MQGVLSFRVSQKLLFHRSITTTSGALNNQVPKTVAKNQFVIRDIKSDGVEKVSLSRGMALNKFEKDFMIFPEYTDSDDVRTIEGFCDMLRASLDLCVDSKLHEKDGHLSSEVLETMLSNALFSLNLPKDVGGCEMKNKDVSRVFEELSIDLNVMTTTWIPHIVSNLLTIFGSEQQKEKYLPAIASGKCRPAIAVTKDVSDASVKLSRGLSVSQVMASGEKIRVVGVHNPNLFVIFTSSKNPNTKINEESCYIVDLTETKETDKIEFQRDTTLGLKAIDVGRLNLSVLLSEANLLGVAGHGKDVSSEMVGVGRLPIGAATLGLAKRVLRDISVMCNKAPSRHTARASLADDTRTQRMATKLALKVYSLESVVYYLSGMLDEGLGAIFDIENALTSIVTRDVLESIVSTLVELAGVTSTDTEVPYEKLIRDVSTLISLVDDGADVEQIAMSTLATWTTSSGHGRMTDTIKRLFKNEADTDTLRNPGLTHYIAEHAHPSLQKACQDLEFSMARVNVVISQMMKTHGKNIEQDYGAMESLVNVLKHNLVMVATISRASRSYSIGLRNADIELAWTIILASRLSRQTWFELDALADIFGLVKMNPSLLQAGRAVFDLGGYPIESPLEKNW